jgi:hypothetical protein
VTDNSSFVCFGAPLKEQVGDPSVALITQPSPINVDASYGPKYYVINAKMEEPSVSP